MPEDLFLIINDICVFFCCKITTIFIYDDEKTRILFTLVWTKPTFMDKTKKPMRKLSHRLKIISF